MVGSTKRVGAAGGERRALMTLVDACANSGDGGRARRDASGRLWRGDAWFCSQRNSVAGHERHLVLLC